MSRRLLTLTEVIMRLHDLSVSASCGGGILLSRESIEEMLDAVRDAHTRTPPPGSDYTYMAAAKVSQPWEVRFLRMCQQDQQAAASQAMELGHPYTMCIALAAMDGLRFLADRIEKGAPTDAVVFCKDGSKP